MPIKHLLVIYLVQTLIVFLPSFGLARLFEKARVEKWKAFVPFYNTWIMQTVAKRPRHWVFWQFIPVVGWFISPGIFIEFVKLFGKFSVGAHTLAALFAPLYFPYLAYVKDVKWIGPEAAAKHKKSTAREWLDAAVFAIVAATLIRTFVFEAYTIPSGSMEKSLLTNDFLFVSKLSYGPRLPNTPLSIPFIHNYIPGLGWKSYTTLVKVPYIRWWPSPVKRGDAVVFNVPAGDTVIHKDGFESLNMYYDIKRKDRLGPPYNQISYNVGENIVTATTTEILNDHETFPIVVHPPDKSDNYIKRCVGVSGDWLQIKDNVVYINNQSQPVPPNSQLHYIVTVSSKYLDQDIMKSEYNLDYDKREYAETGVPNQYYMLLTQKAKEKMLAVGIIKDIKLDYNYGDGEGQVFPYDTLHKWHRDNFGPVWIPKKGASLQLTDSDFNIYERAIRVYEHNDFYRKDGKFYLNGKEVTSYTFKMDYYWMMGDNRQDSQDSRYWGFVPEDRVVGKAWLIWFSWEHGPRWKRLFRFVK
jgi:signal peptidase I